MNDNHDHDADWPWTLYFNGEPLPRWANCWNLCGLRQSAQELLGEKTWFADYTDFCRLHDRMDLAHTVDSEEGDVFRLCCLTLLHLLLSHEAAVLQTLAPSAADHGTTAEIIYGGVRDGLVAMHDLTMREGTAFWTAGYDTDLAALTEVMRRSKLSPSHPEHLEPPHLTARRHEVSFRIRSLRGSLLELLTTRRQPKEIRRFIHELPTNP